MDLNHIPILEAKKLWYSTKDRDIQRKTETAEFEDLGILSEGALVK